MIFRRLCNDVKYNGLQAFGRTLRRREAAMKRGLNIGKSAFYAP